MGTRILSDALGHSTSTTTGVSQWATRLPLTPNVLSEGDLMTLYNSSTTQPPITLPRMATLLSCVRVVPGLDSGPENKQRNKTKSVTRAHRFLPRPIQSVTDRPPQRCHTTIQHIDRNTTNI
jgi:hypothetical protein